MTIAMYVDNKDYLAHQLMQKIYRVLPDKQVFYCGQIKVVSEPREDYFSPKLLFHAVTPNEKLYSL